MRAQFQPWPGKIKIKMIKSTLSQRSLVVRGFSISQLKPFNNVVPRLVVTRDTYDDEIIIFAARCNHGAGIYRSPGIHHNMYNTLRRQIINHTPRLHHRCRTGKCVPTEPNVAACCPVTQVTSVICYINYVVTSVL